MKSLRMFTTSLLISLSTLCGSASAQGNAPLPSPDATVSLNLKVYALALGQKADISSGVLTYQGKKYPFTIKGIGLSENQVGAAYGIESGEVYGLNNLGDFEGKYFQLSGSIEKSGEAIIRSDKKVALHLKGWSKGAVVIQPEGATIEFTKQ
jgi:hypothetical protein